MIALSISCNFFVCFIQSFLFFHRICNQQKHHVYSTALHYQHQKSCYSSWLERKILGYLSLVDTLRWPYKCISIENYLSVADMAERYQMPLKYLYSDKIYNLLFSVFLTCILIALSISCYFFVCFIQSSSFFHGICNQQEHHVYTTALHYQHQKSCYSNWLERKILRRMCWCSH